MKKESIFGVLKQILIKKMDYLEIIHRAIKFDEMRTKSLFEKYFTKPVKGFINHLIDEKGYYYIIQNYFINCQYFMVIINENTVKHVVILSTP